MGRIYVHDVLYKYQEAYVVGTSEKALFFHGHNMSLN
jgi:hypothetical protein